MTRQNCHALRDELHGYRLGEGSPLERQKIELHLEKCAGCNNELYLLHELEQAARVSPTALTDSHKRTILADIHRTLRTQENTSVEVKSNFNWRQWFVMPVGAMACAAALVFMLTTPTAHIDNSQNATTTAQLDKSVIHVPPPQKVLEVKTPFSIGPGVVAFQSAQARARVEKAGTARKVSLNRGAMVAEFNRLENQEPLEIITPHARVIIRGTVFAVRAGQNATTVSVNRGKVEVRANDGTVTWLGAGETIEVGRVKEASVTPSEPLQVAMASHFGPQSNTDHDSQNETQEDKPQTGLYPSPALDAIAQPKEEPKVVSPMARVATKATPVTKAVVKAAPVASPAASGMELLHSARTLWRDGKHGQAIQGLQAVLSGEVLTSLNGRETNEARYLLATIHRDVGDYGRAAGMLRLVANGGNSLTARMAQLELARLESRHLGNLPVSREILENLVQGGTFDIVAEEGLFELCALYIKSNQWAQARACLTKFITQYQNSQRLSEARKLFENLPNEP